MGRFSIFHIITGLSTGGAEMMLYKLLSHTNKQQFTPIVISLMDGGEMRERIKALGVPVYSLGMQRGIPSIPVLLRLRKLMHELKPDVLQGWMYHGNLAASLAALMCSGRPKVFWNIRHSMYDLADEKTLTRLVIRLGAQFSCHPATIIYNARISETQHVELGYNRARSVIIPNGFDTDLLKPEARARKEVRVELGLPDSAPLVGLIGRYHPMKDHGNFLKAAGSLATKDTSLHFLLAGKGVNVKNRELQALIVNNDLQGRVFLLGERRDIPRLTAALDVAVLSSAWGDAFPNVVGEAMACRIPCVVTDVGDAAWIVGDTGKVVPPCNPQALADAVIDIINIDNGIRKKMGELGRQRIKDNFSLGYIVKQYEKMYQREF